MIKTILIVILVCVNLVFIRLLIQKEHFYNDNLEDILNIIDQKNAIDKKDIFFDSVDGTTNKIKKIQNKALSKINISDELLEDYIKTNFIKSSPTMTDSNKLPHMVDNNYNLHNHKLRLLINSKKIRQDYIIDLLQNKLKILLNSLENVNNIKHISHK